MALKIDGVLYDGVSSKAQTSTLVLNDIDQLTLLVDGVETRIEKKNVRISSRLGNSTRYIQISELGKFESTQNNDIDQLANCLNPKGRSNFLHQLESNINLIIIGIIVTIIFIGSTAKWGIPALADYIVDNLPEQTSDAIQVAMVSHLEERWFKPTKLSVERQEQLQALYSSVKSDLGLADKDYQFKLYDAEDSVGANALAFPSGIIVMTDQMVHKVTSDTQIAGIIAHELGHLDGKHSLRQIFRGSILAILVAWITGDISGASAAVVTAPTLLLQLQYSREFETEADRYALRYIGCDQNSLQEMGDFFISLDKTIKGEKADSDSQQESTSHDKKERYDFFSSHPASQKRSDSFRNYYEETCLSKGLRR